MVVAPRFPGERPPGAPDPDPLFDEVFDPVRARPATRAEVRGEGDAARVAQVRRAVRALGAIIGETSANELGHSLGMAQPYGLPTAFHDAFDAEGCLMDRGAIDRSASAWPASRRPRSVTSSRPSYLDNILGP